MKIELDTNTSFTTCFVAVVTAILIAATYGCHQTEETQREMTRAGLVQKRDVQATTLIWTKP